MRPGAAAAELIPTTQLYPEELPEPEDGAGTGLRAYYFNSPTPVLPRLHPGRCPSRFPVGAASPDGRLLNDNFSARWTGQVEPRYSGVYTFYTHSDDGVKLWVNDILLVDQWNDHTVREDRGTIDLVAGTKYDIKMEYYDRLLDAVAKLWWSSDLQVKEIIPQSQLYPAPLATPTPPSTGGGLVGSYYWGSGPNAESIALPNASVDYDWGGGSPASGIPADNFVVRWVGYVEPRYTGTYTFYTHTDDGVMLWVNNQQLFSNWTTHALTEDSGTIDLVAGQTYPIVMEYYEDTGSAVAKLLWSSDDQVKEIIPASQLHNATPPKRDLVPLGGTVMLPSKIYPLRHIYNPVDKATTLAGVPFWRQTNSPIIPLPNDIRATGIGTDTAWSGVIPPGAYIGPSGCGPCVGVALIPPEMGMPTYIIHFSASADVGGAFFTAGFADFSSSDGLSAPEGYRAIIAGAASYTDEATNRGRLFTLADVVDYLHAYDVAITSYVPAAAFAVDGDGRVYWTHPSGMPVDTFED